MTDKSPEKKRTLDEIGARYSRWTVLSYHRKGHYKMALCRCECGQEKEILVSNLKNGRSKSCGCLAKESYRNLAGQRFGLITAICPSDERDSYGNVVWQCVCDCGNKINYSTRQLLGGSKQDCGCVRQKKYDITGRRYGKLVAREPTKRPVSSTTIWRCQCDCGNLSDVYLSNLKKGHTRSCGCLKELDPHTYVDGILVSTLTKKVSKRNTSGYKGVYQVKDKWLAAIIFNKKRYHLGTFTTLEEAVAARKAAEEKYFEPVLQKVKKSE